MSQFNSIFYKYYASAFAEKKARRSKKWLKAVVDHVDHCLTETVDVKYRTIVADLFLREQLIGWMLPETFLINGSGNDKPIQNLINTTYETVQDKFSPYFDFVRYRDEIAQIQMPEKFKEDFEQFKKLINVEWNPQKYEECNKIYNEFITNYDSKKIDDEWSIIDRIPSLRKERSQPPSKPIAESEEFKIYRVNNNTEANHEFWKKGKKGNYWCVLGNNYANNYGGYPFYVVTHLTDIKETPFICYLPSYLEKDTDQAVRNKHNTGPADPEDFNKVYSLLLKADKRIEKFKVIYSKNKK